MKCLLYTRYCVRNCADFLSFDHKNHPEGDKLSSIDRGINAGTESLSTLTEAAQPSVKVKKGAQPCLASQPYASLGLHCSPQLF